MIESLKTERDLRRVKLVNMVTLPVTFLLVAMGFAMSQPAGTVRPLSLGLLIFSVGFNLVTLWLIGHGGGGRGVRLARIYVNLAVNISLVYLLGRHWSPIWLVLVLPPVSTAIYGSRRHTLVSVLQVSSAILGIQLLSGHHSVFGWGEAVSRVLFVVAVSFLINESMRTGEPTTGPH